MFQEMLECCASYFFHQQASKISDLLCSWLQFWTCYVKSAQVGLVWLLLSYTYFLFIVTAHKRCWDNLGFTCAQIWTVFHVCHTNVIC